MNFISKDGISSWGRLINFLQKKEKADEDQPEDVGREGIEPPTQGFSVLCSTD